MSMWPMHLTSLSSSFLSSQRTLTHTLEIAPLKHTHTCRYGHSTCAHTPIHKHTYSQAVNVAGRKWRQLWFYGFIWSVIFIWPSQVFTVLFSRTHTLIIPSPCWCKVRQEHRGRGPEGILLGMYSVVRLFFFFQTDRLTLHKFLFMVGGLKSRRRKVLHIHTHTWELPSAAPFFCCWLLSNWVGH